MEVKQLKIKGVLEIRLSPFVDKRGFWMRTFDEKIFNDLGIPYQWVQENHSRNRTANTVRGLHFILPPYTDGKLIRCVRGRVWDVFVDLRKNSPTIGKWDAVWLTEDDFKWLYIPQGFAHGFCTVQDDSELLYKHDTFYHKESDSGIVWNDSILNIDWPVKQPVISEKDSSLMTFKSFIHKYGGL